MPSLNMIIKSEWFLVLLFIIMLFRTQIQLIPSHNAGSYPKDQADDINTNMQGEGSQVSVLTE